MTQTAPNKETILTEIHGIMRLKRITQQDLSDMLNISKATISRQLNAREDASYDYLFKILDCVRNSDELEAKVIVEYYQDGFFIAHRVERNNDLAERLPGFADAETLVAEKDIVFSKDKKILKDSTYKRSTMKFSGEQEKT